MTVRDNTDQHRFEIFDGEDGEEPAAFLEYELRPGAIALIHTETVKGHEGKGIAKQLVTAVLAEARSRGLAVLPHCPYVRKVIADNPAEYLDLVPAAAREKFSLPSRT